MADVGGGDGGLLEQGQNRSPFSGSNWNPKNKPRHNPEADIPGVLAGRVGRTLAPKYPTAGLWRLWSNILVFIDFHLSRSAILAMTTILS